MVRSNNRPKRVMCKRGNTMPTHKLTLIGEKNYKITLSNFIISQRNTFVKYIYSNCLDLLILEL